MDHELHSTLRGVRQGWMSQDERVFWMGETAGDAEEVQCREIPSPSGGAAELMVVT